MPGIRKVYGPFKVEIFENSKKHKCIRWYFNGIRDNHEMAHWALDYDVKTGRYNAVSLALRTGYIGRLRSSPVKCLPDNRGMFTGGKAPPIMTGKTSDILRKHLRPQDAATAARFRLTGKL